MKILWSFFLLSMPLCLLAEPAVADAIEVPASPYSPLAWSLFPLLAYAISSVLSRTGKLSKSAHRYFWNVVLLAVFAISCGFGVVLACSCAYGWDLGDAYYWMKAWHVNAGIGLLVVGVMHLSRRFHYFLKLPVHHHKSE